MIFGEALGIKEATERLKIYAFDVAEEVRTQARQGGYRPEAVESVPDHLGAKYCDLSGSQYVIHNDLRRSVVFDRHRLIQDAPISGLDLLSCRNTLICLSADTQRQVLARLHFALNDDGFLFLGKAEMLPTLSRNPEFGVDDASPGPAGAWAREKSLDRQASERGRKPPRPQDQSKMQKPAIRAKIRAGRQP